MIATNQSITRVNDVNLFSDATVHYGQIVRISRGVLLEISELI